MSFVEFLIEYYWYILLVLILIVVTVIGFLVDSNNKKKKKVSEVDANNSTTDVNNVSNSEAIQGQSVNDEVLSKNENNNLNNVMPEMVGVSNESKTNGIEDSLLSLQPQVNNSVSDVLNSQPPVMPINNSSNSNMANNINAVNNLGQGQSVNSGNVIPVQPIQTNLEQVIPVESSSMQPVNNILENSNLSSEFNQPQMIIPNLVSTPVQPQLNTNFNDNDVVLNNSANNVGINSGMVSGGVSANVMSNYNSTVNNNIPVMENVNPQIISNPNTNLTSNYSNGMVSNNSVQPAVNNSQLLNNNVGAYNGGMSNHNMNMNQQMNANNNFQNGQNNVVTSNGAQPFDISSMFGNNQ